MSVLIGIALKSLLIGGLTLGLLRLMRNRSSAERSWVAHVGLLALVVIAFAPLALPSWNVEAPAMLGRTQAPAITPTPSAAPIAKTGAVATSTSTAPIEAVRPTSIQNSPANPSLDPIAAATVLYALPAAILLFITFLALTRLVALQARAEVLVDGHWLSALARAQRRMGFKHGTALLTSNELASPVSWGLMRPVILLNSRAVAATEEAEAIIAHELAHVARLDWAKLLLARVATALFWFNPFVWLLAREAHQLREEAADDTVLAADIADTDYAQLLVGVARHECPGMLLGAHGVAPSKSSLARRVARVLDAKLARGPAARGFALGVLAGALLVAAPLAALTLTPAVPKPTKAATPRFAASEPRTAYYSSAPEVPTDLPHIIAKGVSTSVVTAVAAVAPAATPQPAVGVRSAGGLTVESGNGKLVTRSANGATVTVYPPDPQGRRKMVARSPSGIATVTYINDGDAGTTIEDGSREYRSAVRAAVEGRAVGLTPEYIGEMRAAAPRLANLQFSDFSGLRAVGVTPGFARGLVTAGFPSISAEELMEARAVGLSGDYVSAMRSAGIRGDFDDFVQLRAVGIDPSFAARVKASGMRAVSADDLVQLRAMGITRIPAPPAPPRPPSHPHKGLPAASPPAWNPPGSDPGG